MFNTVEQLKSAIATDSPDQFFQSHVLSKHTAMFDHTRISYVSEVLSSDYGVPVHDAEIIVVGSAKLGFALHPKWKQGAMVAPAFRSFNAESDVDLSIFSPRLFSVLWHEVSSFCCKQDYAPYKHKNLGNYLAYGWLRVDQLPTSTGGELTRCENLRFSRGKVRKERLLGHPRVNFGIFYDLEHLRLYQERSIALCRAALENPL